MKVDIRIGNYIFYAKFNNDVITSSSFSFKDNQKVSDVTIEQLKTGRDMQQKIFDNPEYCDIIKNMIKYNIQTIHLDEKQ